jgi:gluconate 2-dehydrogenase gamma chain
MTTPSQAEQAQAAHPEQHVSDMAGSSKALLQKDASTPKVFDEHEWATVDTIAELIIPATDTPGAREAKTVQHLDQILADSPEHVRTSFLEGLWWLDGFCRRRAGQSFVNLTAAQQMQTITELYESHAASEATGTAFVRAMKSWTARIYYSTEIGHRELNKDNRVPPSYIRPCAG